jgi:hypothetical protein
MEQKHPRTQTVADEQRIKHRSLRLDLIPKLNPRELMRALLQMTIETEDTTERLSAPTVPNWNFSPPNPISTTAPGNEQSQKLLPVEITKNKPLDSTCATRKITFRSSKRSKNTKKQPRTELSRSKLPLRSQELKFR